MKYLRLTKNQIYALKRLVDENKKYVRLDTQQLENGDILVLIGEKKDNGYVFINWISERRYNDILLEHTVNN